MIFGRVKCPISTLGSVLQQLVVDPSRRDTIHAENDGFKDFFLF